MSKLSQTCVLIVDDELEIINMISLMLRPQKFSLIKALDGESGIKKALREGPDVIITDLMMPGIDGFTLMERVMRESPDIPVIVMTAYGSMDTAIRALKLGAFDFLIKPLDIQVVRRTVSQAAQQQLNHKHENWQQLIVNSLGTLQAVSAIGETLLTLTGTALGAEYGLLWWPDSFTDSLYLHPQDHVLEPTLTRWAASVDLPHVDNQQPTGRLVESIQLEEDTPFVGSLLGVALLSHKQVHAVLILAHSQPDYFNQKDLSFLENVTPFAALSMDNARNYTTMKAANRRLSTLQGINALGYNAELPLNRVLRLAVEGIRQNMSYPAVFICMPETNSQQLVIRAAAGHFDQFLNRRGDTPRRRVAFPLPHGENLFSLTYQTRQPHHAPQAQWITWLEKAGATDIARAFTDHDIRHGVALPLWGGERVVGVLMIGYTDARPFSVDEEALLEALTNQIAMLITNANLYQIEQRRRREMEALFHAGLVITSTLSHEDVLKAIVQQIIELTNVESCMIGRWDPIKDREIIELHLKRQGAVWIEKTPSGTTGPLTDRPLVKAVLEKQRLRTVKYDDPDLPRCEKKWMTRHEAQRRLIIPLIIKRTSIGFIELISSRNERVFTNQITRIAQGLAAQAAIALENARLHEAEVKLIEQEMDLARRIQLSLLPHSPPAISDLSIAARTVSARLVGGDFFRYFPISKDKFGVVVGDVSGKGVPSALFMAITITAMDTQLRWQQAPGEMLYQLNRILHPRMQASGMNTGLLVAVFNLKQQTLEIANAGMIAPLHKQLQTLQWIDVSGLPLGAVSQSRYQSETIAFNNGSAIILVSDGILEAQNTIGELYGFDRFQQAVQGVPVTASSQQLLDHVWQDVNSYIIGTEPNDDMTMLVIQSA